MDASIFGRGAGEGFGVRLHRPGAGPRRRAGRRWRCASWTSARARAAAKHLGRAFGSNAAAWWGLSLPRPTHRAEEGEVVTVYEVHAADDEPYAKAVYSFRWTPQTDPWRGACHHRLSRRRRRRPDDGRSPVMASWPCACAHSSALRRAGRRATRERHGRSDPAGLLRRQPRTTGARARGAWLYLPVSVEGALFSAGDPHTLPGRSSEVCGTAIECSRTGGSSWCCTSVVIWGTAQADQLPVPGNRRRLGTAGFSFANHRPNWAPTRRPRSHKKSSLDLAMRDAFRKARRYLMKAHELDEDEAMSPLL